MNTFKTEETPFKRALGGKGVQTMKTLLEITPDPSSYNCPSLCVWCIPRLLADTSTPQHSKRLFLSAHFVHHLLHHTHTHSCVPHGQEISVPTMSCIGISVATWNTINPSHRETAVLNIVLTSALGGLRPELDSHPRHRLSAQQPRSPLSTGWSLG